METKDFHVLNTQVLSNNLQTLTFTDTGLLTFIPIASVPALQVLDKKTNSYVDVERHFPKYEYMSVIMGEKMSLFANNSKLTATVHKVKLFICKSSNAYYNKNRLP